MKTEYEFTDNLDEAKNRGKVYIPTLNVDTLVAPLCSILEKIDSEAERVNVFEPFCSYLTLRRLRRELLAHQTQFRDLMTNCLRKLADISEGAPSNDTAWYQGWSVALGMSAVTRLNLSFASASAAIDRKAAYAIAIFSLYVAVISIIISLL